MGKSPWNNLFKLNYQLGNKNKWASREVKYLANTVADCYTVNLGTLISNTNL